MGGRLGKLVWACMMAVATFGLGVPGLKVRIRMEPVQMALDPSISDAGRQQLAEKVKSGASGPVSAAVQYIFKDGQTLTQGSVRLEPYEASSLLAGQSLSVYYDKDRPHAVFGKGELPRPAGWPVGGLALAAVAWFAFGLWRKEGERREDDY